MENEKHKAGVEASAGEGARSPAKASTPPLVFSFSILHFPLATAYIGLGSNLNHPIEQVQQALQALHQVPDTRLLKHSSLYRSTPLGPANQPDYVNAVALLQTRLPPLTLLTHLQAIETQQGRIRTGERWGPRTLDLDILLYDQQQSQDPILTLPHPELHHRNFVIYPLYECNPELVLSDGQRLQELIQRTSAKGLEKLNNE